MLYQRGIDEELSCPADATHSITGAGCNTIADTLLGFFKIRDVLLAFNQDLGPACEQSTDDDAIQLAMAANTGRRDMLKMKPAFSGSFDSNCKYHRTSQLLVRRSS